jgi:hypothetical protein
MKNKLFIISGILLLILIVTNPSQSSFKQYALLKSNLSPDEIICSRIHYYLLWSIYECRWKEYKKKYFFEDENNYTVKSKTYLGIFNNFFSLPLIEPHYSDYEIKKMKEDSIAYADSLLKAVENEAREKAEASN